MRTRALRWPCRLRPQIATIKSKGGTRWNQQQASEAVDSRLLFFHRQLFYYNSFFFLPSSSSSVFFFFSDAGAEHSNQPPGAASAAVAMAVPQPAASRRAHTRPVRAHKLGSAAPHLRHGTRSLAGRHLARERESRGQWLWGCQCAPARRRRPFFVSPLGG